MIHALIKICNLKHFSLTDITINFLKLRSQTFQKNVLCRLPLFYTVVLKNMITFTKR
jgi:hypothetical protein